MYALTFFVFFLRYDIQTGIWSLCTQVKSCYFTPNATIVNDTIYCGDYESAVIECVDLNKIQETSDVKVIETPSCVYNLFSHNRQLYAEIEGYIGTEIRRYNSATEDWTVVTI